MSASPTGFIAEFDAAARLLDAARRARHADLAAIIECYSPCPLPESDTAAPDTAAPDTAVACWTLLGGVLGGVSTYALEWYSAVYDFPIDVGGRPTRSWPAFIPPALEMLLLGAALFGIAAMLIGNGLPRFHHPLFSLPAFDRVSSDRFVLHLQAAGPRFEAAAARAFLESLSPLSISEVGE